MLGVHMQNLKIRGWDYNIPLMSSPKKIQQYINTHEYCEDSLFYPFGGSYNYITLLKHTSVTIYNLPFCHLHPLLPLLTVEVGCFQQGPEIRFRSLLGRDISPGQSWKNGRSLSPPGDLKVLEKFWYMWIQLFLDQSRFSCETSLVIFEPLY